MIFADPPRVVSREPGPQTATGAGDILIDQYGHRYQQISASEVSVYRSATGVTVRTLRPDGIIW